MAESLAESPAVLTEALDQVSDGVLIVRASDWQIEYANPAAVALLGGPLVGADANEWEGLVCDSQGRLFPLRTTPMGRALVDGVPTRVPVVLGCGTPGSPLKWFCARALPLYEHGAEQPYGAVSLFTPAPQREVSFDAPPAQGGAEVLRFPES